ncbi:MAG: hypothetical protein Q7S58_08100 [Candidatus Binatus sp.]|nr:hypothetical protein [Candidatus Binatus sp.]MDO8432357.1 hypothetical protein [Candidatus Binatus sp.]
MSCTAIALFMSTSKSYAPSCGCGRCSASHANLARKLATLEKKYDAQFRVVFDAIRELMTPPEPKKKRPIGFAPWGEK